MESISSPATLPLELAELILDEVDIEKDKSTLLKCTLVCKSWFYKCRSRTFFKIRLNGDNLEGFASLLEANSTLGTYVKDLDITAKGDPDMFARIIPIVNDHVDPLSLSLYIPSTPDGPQRNVSSIAKVFHAPFQGAVHLKATVSCETFADVVELFCSKSFPVLKSLVLRADWNDQNEVIPESVFDPELSPHLTSIALLYVKNPISWWLIRQKDVLRPSKLTLGLSAGHSGLPAMYIRELGASLEHLKILVSSVGEFLPLINLENNINLRSISVSVWDYPALITHHMLSQITSTALEKIDFLVWKASKEIQESWSRLDDLLSSPRFSGVRSITINVGLDTTATPITQTYLPKTYRCRRLLFN